MSSHYRAQKVVKKTQRCCGIIAREYDVFFSKTPTRFLAILNAGLSTGLTEERAIGEASQHGQVEQLIMVPRKSYCFLVCPNIHEATNVFHAMHNTSTIGQDNAVVYLSYFEEVPQLTNAWDQKPPNGLLLLENFVSESEEEVLLQMLNDYYACDNEISVGSLRHRQVMHFGYEFIYGINNVDVNAPLDRKMPPQCDELWPRLQQRTQELNLHMAWTVPDQLTVNVYQPGQGISHHVDTHSAFLDPILSLSLAADVVMEFRRDDDRVPVVVPRRSMLIMSGEARYDWTHSIAARNMDAMPTSNGCLTVRRRSKRTSFTFRRLRRCACDCNFPRHCDTPTTTTTITTTTTATPLDAIALQLEQTNVHNVYERIAAHFSVTRQRPWPLVAKFIDNLPSGAVILDIGCGNGKYLHSLPDAHPHLLRLGCDRSESLLQICSSNAQNIFRCDCLCIPVRSQSIDGCICIAVIHHLATMERRLLAIEEMARILVAGGQALIYVWAKDQRLNNNKSSYLLQNKAMKEKKQTQDEQRHKNAMAFLQQQQQPQESTQGTTLPQLPIHTNRTEFLQQDLLVPWKLRHKGQDDTTFLRFYHVFEEGELEDLVARVPCIKIVKSYYDQGNHCLIFRKIAINDDGTPPPSNNVQENKQ